MVFSKLEKIDYPEDGAFIIESKDFLCGGVIQGGKCTLASPMIDYMMGWTIPQIFEYASPRRWMVDVRACCK